MRAYPYREGYAGRLNWAVIIAIAFMLLAYGICNAQTPAPAPRVRKAWYVRLTPHEGGPSVLMGPWNTYAAAADWDGSALYSHSIKCHITGPVSGNCRNIGNGYAYLKGTPYPPSWQIPSSGPILLPIVHTGQYGQWVRIYYPNDPTLAPIVVIKGKPHAPLPPGQFTNYPINGGVCPGWPWIYIGDTGGPGGDGVCG